MKTQNEMLRILQHTTSYYKSPLKNGWQLSELTDSVFADHNSADISYFFTLDPESKIIKAESWSLNNKHQHTITIYTGTFLLGGRLIAPDIILALHTLFSFDFASDATYVVEKNLAKLMPPAKAKKKLSAASDAIDPGAKTKASSGGKHYSLLDNNISVEPSRNAFFKFVRYVVYPSEIFKRKS
jgi:hypothetical protein